MAGRRPVSEVEAWRRLAEAREVQVAAVVDGRPLLRTMHAVVCDGALVLHGAPSSEKAGWVGAEVVVGVDEVVARIPSWMRHPEKACPATTLYRSVQARGRVEALEDPSQKASALQALMEKLQPEGGHRPIDADHPLYRASVRGLGMWRIVVEQLSAVDRVGSHFTDAERRGVVAGLWRRGAPGDLAALEQLDGPPFFDAPAGLRPRCWPSTADARAAAALVAGEYWNTGFDEATLAAAVLGSSAWVGLESDGGLIATARAVSDGVKRAWIYDVAVAAGWRGRGVGGALLVMMLDHPAVRDTQVSLVTRDAQRFYERFGFEPVVTVTTGPFPRTFLARSGGSPQLR